MNRGMDMRAYQSNGTVQRAEEKAERVQRNATSAPSLSELARSVYRAEQDGKAAERAAEQAEHEAVRDSYLNAMHRRAMAVLPALLAAQWELPADHKFVTSLDWKLVPGAWETAVYTREGSAIHVTPRHSDEGLKEAYETMIDGHRIVAAFYAGSDGESPMMSLSGEDQGVREGLGSLADLGRWLERPL